jgi:ribonuclease T2
VTENYVRAKTMRRILLLLSVLCAFSVSGCTVPVEDSNPGPMDTVARAVETTTAPPAAGMPWPTIAPSTADFDYYILALSWAPDYCSANPDDTQECSLGKQYAFVLHGLWPQYATGYPSNCGHNPLPASVKARFPRLYPNDKLFDHEWSKHGTCTGLAPTAYLALARQLRDQVQVPLAYRAPASPFSTTADDLKKLFLQYNPALPDASLAVNCSGSGRYLSELYICVSKDGEPAACGVDVRKSALKSCARADFLVRSVR